MNELILNVGTPSVCVNVLGNKVDLKSELSISSDEALNYITDVMQPKYLEKVDGIDLFETSALNGENVNESFLSLGQKIIDRIN